jgi:uncharacterized membrane protein YkvA (DUF1232 family)
MGLMANSNPDPNPTVRPNVGVLMSLVNRLRLVFRLLADRRVPFPIKLVPFASLAYVLFPIDLVPDLLPFLGQLDDLGAVLLALETFIFLCPQDVVSEHKAQLEAGTTSTYSEPKRSGADDVVDGEWRRVR